jgi:hypothetical protein
VLLRTIWYTRYVFSPSILTGMQEPTAKTFRSLTVFSCFPSSTLQSLSDAVMTGRTAYLQSEAKGPMHIKATATK